MSSVKSTDTPRSPQQGSTPGSQQNSQNTESAGSQHTQPASSPTVTARLHSTACPVVLA